MRLSQDGASVTPPARAAGQACLSICDDDGTPVKRFALAGLLDQVVRPVLEPLGYEHSRAERTFLRATSSGNWAAISFDPFRGRAGQFFIDAGAQSVVVADWFSRSDLMDTSSRTAWDALCRWRLPPSGLGDGSWTVDGSDVAIERAPRRFDTGRGTPRGCAARRRVDAGTAGGGQPAPGTPVLATPASVAGCKSSCGEVTASRG